MTRPSTLTALRPLISQPRLASSSRPASSSSSSWPSKTHFRSAPTIPNPLPALYAKQIVLSDGSTFTAHLTSPSPSTIRLTRDVTNNPLWAPGTEKRGLGAEGEEGRVGRFRRRFEGLDMGQQQEEGAAGKEGKKGKKAFEEGDLEWMSVGAVEEKIGGAKAAPVKGGKKK